MKRKIILPVALALLVGGVFAWQSLSFAHLQSKLEKETADIAVEYASVITHDILPLGVTHKLNEIQTKLIVKIKQQSTLLQDLTMSVENRVQAITDLQIALNRFSTTSADMHDFAIDPLFAQLQTAVGEHGKVRTLLENYNATAVEWNQRIQSDAGSLFNKIDGSQRSILPYLRFDGQQEFVPVIQI